MSKKKKAPTRKINLSTITTSDTNFWSAFEMKPAPERITLIGLEGADAKDVEWLRQELTRRFGKERCKNFVIINRRVSKVSV